MKVVWSKTALDQLDEIYDTIATERDIGTATKWYFRISDSVANLSQFPMAGPLVPECAFAGHFSEFTGLRQLVIRPYRVVYEIAEQACNILGVMRTSRLLDNSGSL